MFHLNTYVSRSIFGGPPDDSARDTILFQIAERGGVGVNVFFAISGFILALPFARQRLFNSQQVDLKAYYIRRLTRLEPPYLVSLVLLLLVHVILLHEALSDIFPNFIASLFYLHNIVFDSWSKINPVAWSLEVEVQFYVLAPFLATIFSVRDKTLRRSLIVAMIIGGIIHYNLNFELIQQLHLRKSLFMHIHQFMIGFLFADFFLVDGDKVFNRKSFLADVIAVAALSFILMFNTALDIMNDLFFEISLFVALFCLFKGRITNRVFTNRWIVIIGGMCYSIYLLHYAIIAFLTANLRAILTSVHNFNFSFMLGFVLVLPVVLVISAVFFVLVERPCMDKDWPRKLYSKLRSLITRPA